jgi:hypothetical protein
MSGALAAPARPRLLRLRTFEDVSAELERLIGAAEAGTLREVGSWQAGNTLRSLAEGIGAALDGSPERGMVREGAVLTRRERRTVRIGTFLVRLFGPLMKTRRVKWGRPEDLRVLERLAGMRTENRVARVPFDVGAAELYAQLVRLAAGERMTQRSPVLGKMTHEQWTALLLTNANMQLGMLAP